MELKNSILPHSEVRCLMHWSVNRYPIALKLLTTDHLECIRKTIQKDSVRKEWNGYTNNEWYKAIDKEIANRNKFATGIFNNFPKYKEAIKTAHRYETSPIKSY